MDKILRGVHKFSISAEKERFLKEMEQKAAGLIKMETVYVTCIDPRVLTTDVTESKAGEIFYVRNAGNMVPAYQTFAEGNVSGEGGALELGCVLNKISNVVVCGHSDCKAMQAMYGMRHDVRPENTHVKDSPLVSWVAKNALPTVKKFSEVFSEEEHGSLAETYTPMTFTFNLNRWPVTATIDPENQFDIVDKFSMVHTLQQAYHVSTYPFLKDLIEKGELTVNALWFDLHSGTMFVFSPRHETFVAITENNVEELIEGLDLEK